MRMNHVSNSGSLDSRPWTLNHCDTPSFSTWHCNIQPSRLEFPLDWELSLFKECSWHIPQSNQIPAAKSLFKKKLQQIVHIYINTLQACKTSNLEKNFSLLPLIQYLEKTFHHRFHLYPIFQWTRTSEHLSHLSRAFWICLTQVKNVWSREPQNLSLHPQIVSEPILNS